jgi:hypothetical protein
MGRTYFFKLPLGVVFTCLIGCGPAQGPLLTDSRLQSFAAAGLQPATNLQPPAALPFKLCDRSQFTDAEPTGFSTWGETLWSRQGAFNSAQDAVTSPASDANANVWFQYGVVRHPIVNQSVTLSADLCDAYHVVGTAHTDNHGHALVRFAAPPPGRFTLIHQADGDASKAAARLWVLPPKTHVVVFDIDGTLTVNNAQFAKQILDDDYVPVAFAGAVAATQMWAQRNYVLLYMTGRPHAASQITRNWLKAQGFATGILHLSNDGADLRANNAGVGTFKRDYLAYLQRLGLVIDFAYGNETTDVYAYRESGLQKEQIFMLGEQAGYAGTGALPDGYGDHLQFIDAQPAVQQPFAPPIEAPLQAMQRGQRHAQTDI